MAGRDEQGPDAVSCSQNGTRSLSFNFKVRPVPLSSSGLPEFSDQRRFCTADGRNVEQDAEMGRASDFPWVGCSVTVDEHGPRDLLQLPQSRDKGRTLKEQQKPGHIRESPLFSVHGLLDQRHFRIAKKADCCEYRRLREGSVRTRDEFRNRIERFDHYAGPVPFLEVYGAENGHRPSDAGIFHDQV